MVDLPGQIGRRLGEVKQIPSQAEVKIKDWLPRIKPRKCYLYDLKAMGITPEQFADVISGSKAYLFEKPIVEVIRASRCAWCTYNDRKQEGIGKRGAKWRGTMLQDHIYAHDKNIVDFQVNKFHNNRR